MSDARPLGDLVRELEARGMLRTLLAPPGTASAGFGVSAVEVDSRRVAPGALFVAVPGGQRDGHDFVGEAVARGAVAIIGERAVARAGVPQLLVSSARSAAAVAAAWVHDYPSRRLGIIGVTGTDGKTTTTYLIRAMLEACGVGTGLISTIEVICGGKSAGYTGHTTPEAPVIQSDLRRMLDAGDRMAVVETTSHGIALERVSEIEYDIAVLTNISHEHLDLHGTFAAYVAAKRSLFERLGPRAGNSSKGWPKVGVVNAQDAEAGQFAEAARSAGARVIQYGVGPGGAADVEASSVRDTADGLSIHVRTARWEDDLELRLPGRFNAFNALAAVAVGEALDLEPQAMRAGLASVDHVAGRLQPIDQGQPFSVFVDFAHTPRALAAVLDGLAPLAAARGGSLIAVFGSPGARDIAKRPMMGREAGQRSRIVVLTDDDPRNDDRMGILEQIAAGAISVGKRRDHDLFLIPDRGQAIRRAMELAAPGDVVLLAGKGHEPTLATAAGPIPWDEAATARAALAELGYDG